MKKELLLVSAIMSETVSEFLRRATKAEAVELVSGTRVGTVLWESLKKNASQTPFPEVYDLIKAKCGDIVVYEWDLEAPIARGDVPMFVHVLDCIVESRGTEVLDYDSVRASPGWTGLEDPDVGEAFVNDVSVIGAGDALLPAFNYVYSSDPGKTCDALTWIVKYGRESRKIKKMFEELKMHGYELRTDNVLEDIVKYRRVDVLVVLMMYFWPTCPDEGTVLLSDANAEILAPFVLSCDVYDIERIVDNGFPLDELAQRTIESEDAWTFLQTQFSKLQRSFAEIKRKERGIESPISGDWVPGDKDAVPVSRDWDEWASHARRMKKDPIVFDVEKICEAFKEDKEKALDPFFNNKLRTRHRIRYITDPMTMDDPSNKFVFAFEANVSEVQKKDLYYALYDICHKVD